MCCVFQGVLSLWSATVSNPVDLPWQQTQCASVVPDLYGVFPPRLSLLCELNTNNKNDFLFKSGQQDVSICFARN